MAPIFVVTGPTGVGKSHMLRQLVVSGALLHIVDGLAEGCTHFEPPANPSECKVVAVDHIELGQWALAEDAFAWCEENDKQLWVVVQDRQSMAIFIPEILEGAVEMQLAQVDGQMQMTFVHGAEKRVFSPSDSLAAGIIANAVGK